MINAFFSKLAVAFRERWHRDIGKVLLVTATIAFGLAAKSWWFSFDAPAQPTLTAVSGALHTETMYRGNVYRIDAADGTQYRFTCYRGADVFCPRLQEQPSSKMPVKAHYSQLRPELLLQLDIGGRPVLAYERMKKIYQFNAYAKFLVGTGILFMALFVFSPLMQKRNRKS